MKINKKLTRGGGTYKIIPIFYRRKTGIFTFCSFLCPSGDRI